MKTTLVLTLLLAASSLYLFYSDKTPEQFNQNFSAFSQWKQTYGQKFDATEESYRFAVFSENVELINQHNSLGESFRMALNQFASLSQEEFSQRNTRKAETQRSLLNVEPKEFNLGEKTQVNWTTKGKVAPVQNQGNCGSCWAFGAVSQLESLNAIKNGNLEKFSEQQVTSCTHAAGFRSNGCNGGFEIDGFNYVKKFGIQSYESYPYAQATVSVTQPCEYNQKEVIFQNTGAEVVSPNDPNELIRILKEQPVSVGVAASNLAFQFYQSGVVTNNCGGWVDHAVSATGFNTEAETPYFIVKNSWGTGWGNEGYIWIEITSGQGMCKINSDASYPTLK